MVTHTIMDQQTCACCAVLCLRMMPKAVVGDFILVADTGAYTLSMYSRYVPTHVVLLHTMEGRGERQLSATPRTKEVLVLVCSSVMHWW